MYPTTPEVANPVIHILSTYTSLCFVEKGGQTTIHQFYRSRKKVAPFDRGLKGRILEGNKGVVIFLYVVEEH